MGMVLLALGLVLVVEGLVWALAPGLIESMLAAIAALPLQGRRLLGLGTLAAGVALLWVAKTLGV